MPVPKKPTLSAITCNYNHGYCIAEQLEAVLGQEYRPLELIVVDDGSTDNSIEVIEEFVRKDSIVRLIRNDRNRGAAFSFNRGLDLATGDYVVTCSADDKVLPGFFEKAMKMASDFPQAGVIFGAVQHEEIGSKSVVTQWRQRFISEKSCFVSPDAFFKDIINLEYSSSGPGYTATTVAVVFRRDALTEIGGYRIELECNCDDFAGRVIGLKYGVCYIPEICMAFRLNPASLSGSSANDFKMQINIAGRAAWLMKTQFRDRFPEIYARQWEKKRRNYIANKFAGKFCTQFNESLATLGQGLKYGSLIHRVIGRLLIKAAVVLRWVCTRWYRSALIGYPADLACFADVKREGRVK